MIGGSTTLLGPLSRSRGQGESPTTTSDFRARQRAFACVYRDSQRLKMSKDRQQLQNPEGFPFKRM